MMRSYPPQAIKVLISLVFITVVVTLLTLTPNTTATAAPSGVAPVDVIYTNLPGDPTSEVPGLPGVRFEPSTTSSAIFDRVYGSQNGNWAFLAVTDLAAAEDEVLVVNNVVQAREGTTIGTVPNPIFAFDTKLGVNNDGEVVFATDTTGATTSDEYILQVDGATVTVIANEGTATGLPTLPGTTWGSILESPAIDNTGTVGFSADVILGVPSTQDDLLVLGSTVVAQEGVTVPTGQIGTEAWENYDLGEFWISADGTDWIVQGDLSGATATDGVVVVNGAVVIQEGVILPGSGYTETVGTFGNINLHMDGGGGWMARGTNTGSLTDWVYRNGAVVAQTDAPIFTGASELYDDTDFAATFFLNVGNSNGDYVIGGVTNAPSTSNGVLVHNNTTVIAREGDPLDINGNGSNDDDAFLNTFGNDDGYLSDAGIYYFMATIRNAAGAQTGQGFFAINLAGGGTPTPTATPDPAPTNTPTATATSDPTATPTATATSDPTATATATATNTPGTATSTPTATVTPGGGAVTYCSTFTPLTIADNVTITGTLSIPDNATILDANLQISTTHTFVGDLIYTLSNGTSSAIVVDRPGRTTSGFGCGGDNIPGVYVDDEGTDGAWETSCGTGNPAYPPNSRLIGGDPASATIMTAFDGDNSNGTWSLSVSDNAGGDTGTLDEFCLELQVQTGGPTFTPTPTPSPTTPPQVPDINVNPSSFEETHNNPPQVTTDTMNIGNTGNATLTWTITEDDSRPFANPNPAQPRDDSAPVQRLGGAGGTTISKLELGPIVGDGSFETGTPNASWEEFSSNFGTPLCDAVCGTGGGTGPRTGAWWAWFGGTTAAETGIITQTVTIPSGSAELSFWLEIPATATGTNGFLSVRMDGTEVFRAEETTTGYATYAEVTVDVSAYADGGAHELVFFSITDAGAAVTNFFIDDVAITAQAGGQCSTPTDIPWLTVSPLNGSTAGGGSTPTILTYNSASLSIGLYTGTLCIASNDPDEALVTVPITLAVSTGPTAIDLSTFTSPMRDVNLADLTAAGLLLLAGAVLVLRRK